MSDNWWKLVLESLAVMHSFSEAKGALTLSLDRGLANRHTLDFGQLWHRVAQISPCSRRLRILVLTGPLQAASGPCWPSPDACNYLPGILTTFSPLRAVGNNRIQGARKGARSVPWRRQTPVWPKARAGVARAMPAPSINAIIGSLADQEYAR